MSYPRRNAATQRFTLGAPRTIIVSRDGRRVMFCRSSASDDPVNRLYAIDLPNPEPRLVVDPVALAGDGDVELSDAEKARRERAREGGGGIVTYTTHSDHQVVAFVLGGQLFRTDVATGTTVEVPTADSPFDPRFSSDATQIGYCSAGALRVSGPDGDRLVVGPDDGVANVAWGAAEFVAAEEMGRSRGFWWSPDSGRMLVTRVDTSPVERWHISEPVDASIAPRSIPYPAAGTANATVDLFVIAVDGSTRVPIDWRRDEFEYLARAEWTERNGITLTAQSRDQRTQAIMSVNPETGAVDELVRSVDPAWIELISGAPRRWADRVVTVADDHDADTRRLFVDGTALTPPGLAVRAIQHLGSGHAIVAATTEPTEQHVMRVALDGSGIEALTSAPGVHRAVAGGDTVVLTSSTLDDTLSSTTIHSGDADPIEIENLAERPDLDHQISFHIVTKRELRSALVLPCGEPEGPLPVLLDPYGGPHAQRVLKARAAFSASQWFADQGFAVIVTDGASTPARGPRFEQQVLGNLAAPVLDDQIDALHAMAETHGELLDLERVGIRGWSFGGYLAALAVLKRPDVFHAAIAGAPVTDWRLYDTHYTERYLGHPASDPGAYERSDLTPLAPGLKRPLMLIHGLADDNVVAAHSFRLSRALLEAGRLHTVLPLSGVSHMTPKESVAENLLKLQVDFLDEHLA